MARVMERELLGQRRIKPDELLNAFLIIRSSRISCRDRIRRDPSQADRGSLAQHGEQDVLIPAPNIKFTPPPPLASDGVGDLLTNMATCCRPVNAMAIVGFVTRVEESRSTGDCRIWHRTEPDVVPVTWVATANETCRTARSRLTCRNAQDVARSWRTNASICSVSLHT